MEPVTHGPVERGHVAFSLEPPARAAAAPGEARSPLYERPRILLRIVLWIVLSWLSQLGIWLVPPVVSALLVAQHGGRTFLARHGAAYARALSIYLGLGAFLLFATDELPDVQKPEPVRLSVRPSGDPTVGSALLRILWIIPHAIVLWLLGLVATLLALVALVTVLVARTVPAFIRELQEGFLAWQARALAYYASLVEEYPPFSLEVEPTESRVESSELGV